MKKEFKFIRTFSTGYTQKETERLQDKYAVTVTFNTAKDGSITKTEEGEEFTQGAYSGYKLISEDPYAYEAYSRLKAEYLAQ